jgi:glycerophosphoryl diester phosphodiesterase
MTPKVIAHRGASAVRRENTVAAFEEARRLGADMVELDVRRTRDGALVIHHDAALPDAGPIVELDRNALPSWVPTLEQAVDACAGMVVNIEVKSSPNDPDFDEDRGVARTVAARVAEHGWRDRVLVSSFDLVSVDRVLASDETIPTALLTLPGIDTAEAAAVARDRGHRALHPHDFAVTPDLVDHVHGLGMAVNVWTVDDPDRMLALVEMGVDGICTNLPDVLMRVLAGRGGRRSTGPAGR